LLRFNTTILQFEEQGEKTGWTYIRIPATVAAKLNPGNKKAFRAKGRLDEYGFHGMALLPMGDGDYIMALNAEVRKKIRKGKGASLKVQLEFDEKPLTISKDLLECLRDEPRAFSYFRTLNKSHQGYFSKWIESAKTEQTRAKRIAIAVNSLAKGFGFPEMLRAQKQKNRERES
jgi:Domain of unknown function (DUF1905)/Bacteriocin-protection, YdeI or OmpD-Associated